MQEKYTVQARNALTMAEKTAKRCQHRERMYRIVSGANKTANWQKGSIG